MKVLLSTQKDFLNFSSFYEIENIEASSFLLREGKYEELKVDEFKEKDEIEDSFYDDSKSVNFIFPGLTQGARTRLKYSQKIKNPRFLNSIFFGNIYPIIANSLTIIVDKDVDIIFKEFNTENTPIEFQKTKIEEIIPITGKRRILMHLNLMKICLLIGVSYLILSLSLKRTG